MIHSLLSIGYIAGTFLGTKDRSVRKNGTKISTFTKTVFLREEADKYINKELLYVRN